MKKIGFVAIFMTSAALFFIAGSIVGYALYEKQVKDSAESSPKTKRKPISISGISSNIIGKKTDGVKTIMQSKTRIPSTPAIEKARGYQQIG